MTGGPRKNAGRKALPAGEKRVMLAVRLQPATVEWIRKQPGSQSALIERLVAKERSR